MIAKRIIIRGRVQGVAFRFSLVDIARDMDVTGWVRNRFDGTVEALVQGEPTAIQRVVDWCRRGPPAARVTEIEVGDVPADASRTDLAKLRTAGRRDRARQL